MPVLTWQLQNGTFLLQIKFSTKSFGIEAAEVAARAIENIANSLTHADISDIIAGRPEKEVLGALQIISQSLAKAKLKALDLSDNALGQKGIIACTQAFTQQVPTPPHILQIFLGVPATMVLHYMLAY